MLGVLVALALTSDGTRAQDGGDAYLDAIRKEVVELDDAPSTPASDRGGRPSSPEPPAMATPSPPPPRGAEADQASFEAALRQAYPGSFILYRKLSERYQREVVATYRNTGNWAAVREQILQSLTFMGRSAPRQGDDRATRP